MTGVVEAVSITLAIVPIIISAAEHFSSATRALKRYRRFSSEIGRLSISVKLQRTIFHGEIRSLLASSVGWDQAEHLLQDTGHPRWKDDSLEESFVIRLGSTGESFLELMDWIKAELSEMETRLAGFEEVAQLAKNGDLQNDRHWRQQVKQKCCFAFSQSRLQDSLNTLKDLIESLGTLRSQTERSEQRRPLSQPSTAARKVIEQFTVVQSASHNLYDALKSACTKHTQHQANFSLQPTPGPNAHQVRFTIGFSQFVATTSEPKQTIWFTVESNVRNSRPCGAKEEPQTLSAIGQAIKRSRMSPSPPPQKQPAKLRKKGIQFQLPLPTPPAVLSLPPSCEAPRPLSEPSFSNFCTRSNFCNQLQNFLSQSRAQSECCIGYLEQSSDSKHLIYLKGQEATSESRFNIPSSSLAELLSQYQRGSDEVNGIAQLARLSLSRKLATAVLQFYSTPWLRNTWNSRDVLFRLQTSACTGQIDGLKEPFVDVSVLDSAATVNNDQPAPCYPFAPNDFLFGLGVMLLELAFQKPLRSMQKQCDVANSLDERHTLFFTAKRMSRLVSAKSGSRYGEIVRKCLACDFGRGDDLSQPALQEAVYREVVCELTELENLLRDLDLGP